MTSGIFAGSWNYPVIGTWGAGTEEFATDLISDPFSQAHTGKVLITGSTDCDVAVRWPALFSYTERTPYPDGMHTVAFTARTLS